MKGTKNEKLLQIEIDESLGERIAALDGLALIQRGAHAALLRNDGGVRHLVDDIGNVNRLRISESAGEQADVARFLPQIGFPFQIVRKLLRQCRRAVTSQRRYDMLKQAHQYEQDAHISRNLLAHSGPEDLDDHLASVMQLCGVDLCYRPCGQRLAFKAGKGRCRVRGQ